MKESYKKWSLIWLVAALTFTSIAYRLIHGYGHSHNGLMFVGLPAILALLLILSGPCRTTCGQVFKGVTLFLLLVGILAWEGLICILMAAPIFYLIAFVIFGICSLIRDRTRLRSIAIVPIAVLAIEGTNSTLSFERNNRVEITRSYTTGELDVIAVVTQAPDFGQDLPAFFKAGFPVPLEASAAGDFERGNYVRHQVLFSGPESYENELIVHAKRVDENVIEFDFAKDSTKIGSWMTWQKATLKWEATEVGVDVSFIIDFERNLDPYWYFTPIQKYAVRHAGAYLLDAWFDG
jgi:hypothetical protein